MSTAVLPRFSELCKDLNVDHENLILPPLRIFPESYSRDSSQSSSHGAHKYAHPNLSEARRPLGPGFSNNVAAESEEVHHSCYNRSSTNRDSCSRDSTPSDDDGLDQETEFEDPRNRHDDMSLFHSNRLECKPSVSGTKPKKVKYHFCEICQKAFPRPSGLRAHMNMHTKEKPFECGFPGCPKRFSVSSNAKRHLRTHGVGLSPSDEPSPLPYIVDFEEPMVVPMGSDHAPGRSHTSEPMSLRWMPLGADSRRSQKAQIFTQMF